MGRGNALTYDGVPVTSLGARLGVEDLTYRERVGSTLDLIHDFGAGGIASGAVVLADEQTSGRGRHGRYWYSPRGAGIWLGYLLRVVAPLETGVLSLRVGLAVVRALRALDIVVQLKWPNDIFLGERKLGGILCEARTGEGGWIAIGLGMNVYGSLPDELRVSATSLEEHHGPVSRLAVLEHLLPALGRLSLEPLLTDAERAAFANADTLRGRRLERPVRGIVSGIDEDGALLVETETGVERVLGGTVEVE